MTNAEYREELERLNEELRNAHDKIKQLEKEISRIQKTHTIGWDSEYLP